MKKIWTAMAITWFAASGFAADTIKCEYAPDANTLKVEWSGFKTNQKIEVKGKFTSAKVQQLKKSYAKLEDILNGAQAEADMTTVDSGNPGRDENLKKNFFGLLKDNGKATGKLDGVKATSETTGTGTLHLKFNGVSKDVPVDYMLDKGSSFVTVSGKIDVLDFGGQNAIAALNKACFDVHKGTDGVSKTWSEAHFAASIKVTQSCK